MNRNREILGVVLSVMLWCGAAMAKEAGTESSPAFELSVAKDKLSAQIKDIPLKTVLEKLAEQVPLKLYFSGMVGAQKISANFTGVPLQEGIQLLLSGTSYVLSHSKFTDAVGNGPAVDTLEIRVSPSDTGVMGPVAGSEQQPKAKPKKSLPELIEQALHAPKEQDRIAALQALHEQYQEKEVLPVFVNALQDKAEEVRLTALNFLSNSAVKGREPVPYAPIASLVTQDSSLRVRTLALKVASDIDAKASTELLKSAVNDPDPMLARLARVMLKSREASFRPLPLELEKKLRSQNP